MTVTTTESSNTWIADGSTNEFSFTFPILDESNLLVKKRNYSGVLVNMVLGIDYTVTGIGNLPERTNYKSGKITFLRNIQLESIIIIERNIPKTQEIDYVENTGLPAQGHEEALDKITMALQELNTESKNTVTLAPDVENINPKLSNIKPDDLLKIAPDGSGIIGIEIDDLSYDTETINSVSQDNSPTLGNTLNTNGHNIRFESEHGLVNSADNPILTVKYDDKNTSHLEIDTTKEHQQPIIRATSDNENTDLILEAKGNGSIQALNSLSALQGISVTGSIQATDNENENADLVLKSKGSGNVIIDDVPIVNEINALKNTITTLENKVTNTEIDITDTKKNIITVSTKISDLENKINTIEEIDIPAMEPNIAIALNKVNAIGNNVTVALNKINDLENNIITINNNVKTTDKKINTINNTVNIVKNSVTTSSTKINELENTVNTLENNITNSSIKTDNMESRLTNINSDIEYVENNLIDKSNIKALSMALKSKQHGYMNTQYDDNSVHLDYFLIRDRNDNHDTGYEYRKDICWAIPRKSFRSPEYSFYFNYVTILIDPYAEYADLHPIPDDGYRHYIGMTTSKYSKLSFDILIDHENNDDIEIFESYSSHPEKTLQFEVISRFNNQEQKEIKCLGIYMPGEYYKWHAMIHICIKNISSYMYKESFILNEKKHKVINNAAIGGM